MNKKKYICICIIFLIVTLSACYNMNIPDNTNVHITHDNKISPDTTTNVDKSNSIDTAQTEASDTEISDNMNTNQTETFAEITKGTAPTLRTAGPTDVVITASTWTPNPSFSYGVPITAAPPYMPAKIIVGRGEDANVSHDVKGIPKFDFTYKVTNVYNLKEIEDYYEKNFSHQRYPDYDRTESGILVSAHSYVVIEVSITNNLDKTVYGHNTGSPTIGEYNLHVNFRVQYPNEPWQREDSGIDFVWMEQPDHRTGIVCGYTFAPKETATFYYYFVLADKYLNDPYLYIVISPSGLSGGYVPLPGANETNDDLIASIIKKIRYVALNK